MIQATLARDELRSSTKLCSAFQK